MGRTYLAETAVQQYVDSLLSLHDSAVGLIVGQMTASKDFVVHMVATPALSSEGGDVEPPCKRWLSIDTIDEQYITNHARQVTRMLVGGFDIIGLFACASPDEWKSAQAKLRQVLYSIHTMLNKKETTVVDGRSHTDRLLLHLCSLTKKLTCRTFDVADHKSAGSPAEFKFQRTVDDFVQVRTHFSFSCVLPVPISSMAFSLNKQILSGLQPVFKNIWNSLATVNGSLVVDDSEALVSRTSDKEKTRKRPRDDSPTPPSLFSVDLIQDLLPVTEFHSPTLLECSAKMTVQGTVAGRACVHFKSSVSDALQALKRDVIRSIIARCELLCEDLLQAEEEQDVKVVYETPLRVFTALPQNTSIEFCDYMFPDETLVDSANRFQDLVGIEVDDNHIDASVEHIPTDADLERVTSPTRRSTSSQHDESLGFSTKASSTIYRYVGAVSSVVVASLAAAVMYWYSSPDY